MSLKKASIIAAALSLTLALLGEGLAQEPELFAKRTAAGLELADGKSGVEMKLAAPSPELKAYGSVETQAKRAPGWFKLEFECKSEGFEPQGSFIVDIYAKGAEGAWQPVSASPDWAPVKLYLKLPEEETFTFRALCEPSKGTRKEAASIEFRNFKIESWAPAAGENLVEGGDLSGGATGWLPPLWTWQYNGEKGDYGVVEDKSFQSGEKTVQVKLSGEKGRTLAGFKLPLLDKGTLELSVWAKAEGSASLSLLLIGDNYKWTRSKESQLTGGWTKYVLETPCPSKFASARFWPRIDVKGEGSVRLAKASLVWKDSNAEADAKAEWFKPLCRNMLENSGFELGWNGWTFDNFYPPTEQLAIETANAPEVRLVPGAGPDGSTALSVFAGTAVISSCFPIVDGKEYTLSGMVKGARPDAEVTIFVIDPGWHMTAKKLKPSQEWTKFSHSFKWKGDNLQRRAYVRIDANGALFDKLQFEEGKLSDYEEPPMAVGILAPEGNVAIKGEKPLELVLKLIPGPGAPSAAKAALNCSDFWGRNVWTKEFSFSGNEPKEFKFTAPDEKKGVFEIDASVVAPDGKLVAFAKSRYGVVKKLAPSKAEFPIFGSHCDSFPRPLWMLEKGRPLFELAGASLNRTFLSADSTKDGVSPAYAETLGKQLSAATPGRQIVCIDFPKELMKEVCDEETLTPETLAKYKEWLKSVVVPLKGKISNWEILNESNLWRDHSEGPKKGFPTMPPAKYVEILKASHEIVKASDPSATVFGLCVNGADFDYTEKAFKLEAGKCMDVFSIHPYRRSPDNPQLLPDLLRYRAIAEANGFRGPIVNTEQGYFVRLHPTRGNWHSSDPHIEESEACVRTVRNFIQQAAAGIPECMFNPNGSLFHLGTFDQEMLYWLFGALNAEASFLEGSGAGKQLQAGDAMRAFLFMKAKEGPLLALYSPGEGSCGSISLPLKNEAFDMNGNRIESARQPLTGAPVYLRFAKGTSEATIVDALAKADVAGLGDPFSIKTRMKDASTLDILVENMINKELSGEISIASVPEGWTLDALKKPFSKLKSGETACVEFKGALPMESLGSYKISLLAKSGDLFARKELTISPLFAGKAPAGPVDADLAKWKNAKWISLGEDMLSPEYSNGALKHAGAEDLSAKAAFAWTPGFFEIAVEVVDDVACFPSSPALGWGNDSVQIYFDQKGDAVKPDSQPNGDDLSYCVSLAGGRPAAWLERAPDGRFIGEANAVSGLDPEVQVAVKREGVKTFYEIRIPAKCLPQVKLEQGASFGFSLLVNDNDGKGRKQGLTLAPAGSEPFGRPYFYKSMILQ